ncbi:MAG: hypothetical protein RLZZ161_1274, partial [Bacteroidota bacterium]
MPNFIQICIVLYQQPNNMQRVIPFLLIFLFGFNTFSELSAQNEIIYTAKKIYVGDTAMKVVESVVCDNDKIIFTGLAELARALYPKAKTVDFKNQFMYPGFIDAHCHFLAWCRGLKEADLVGTNSEKEVIKRLSKFAKTTKRGWIVGRGWDQNDWKNKNYPTLASLDKAFPNTP